MKCHSVEHPAGHLARLRQALPCVLGRPRWVVALALVLLLVPSAAVAKGGRVIERIAAVVNGEVIPLSKVYERAAPMLESLEKAGEGDDALARRHALQEALRDLIDEQLIETEVKARAQPLTDAEIDRAIEEVRRKAGLDPEAFRRAIEAQGYTWEGYRRELAKQIQRFRLLAEEVRSKVQVTDEDVRTYLAQKGETLGGEELRVRHILIRVPENAPPEEVARARERAERARVRIVEDGEDFGKVAKEVSEDPGTAADGGDLGWFGRGRMVKPFEEAAFAAKPGEVVGPIRTPFGWHLLQVRARRVREEGGALDAARMEQARQELFEREMELQTRRYLEALRRKAVIEIKVEALKG
ncbi:MAG: peptidylprolyl isomerase [Deltaproteobacteria bacterium]|nr:MAG: peptidylprolyl isomerase [Deltaproteobacteria bacterium]